MDEKKGPWNMPNSRALSMSSFNLSHERKMSGQLGKLYPALIMDCIPGDSINIDLAALVRFQPLVAPPMHAVRIRTYGFFVPYRLLWPREELSDSGSWEEFITRGKDGTSLLTPPIWQPAGSPEVQKGTLWDYFGLPTGIIPPVEACPLDFPRRAYNFIWNEWFRDQDLQNPVALDQTDILRINWDRDYFTSARPFQQRGTAPAFPLQSIIADFPESANTTHVGVTMTVPGTVSGTGPYTAFNPADDAFKWFYVPAGAIPSARISDGSGKSAFDNIWSTVFEAMSAADINDVRYMIQLQVLQELLARSGVRYTEFLRAVYGVAPTDARLDRPEFIGSTVDDVLFSEVLQTAEGSEPVGTMAGHGISTQSGFLGRYTVQEHGLLMVMTVVTPKPAYQDGIQRWLLKRSFADFYFPEFAGLSEQEVWNAELCTLPATQDADGSINRDIFGFQGRYDEYRSMSSSIAGDFRDTFDYWHFSRQFTPTAADMPVLDEDFVQCVPRLDPFAVQTGDHLLMAIGFHMRALRPLPPRGIPASLFTRI
nr:MAG: major capsid protein [Microvirus sp.]